MLIKLVNVLCELFEIKGRKTSLYHPMTNGITEWEKTFILQALRAYCKGQQEDWLEIPPGIMMAYIVQLPAQYTQFSPFSFYMVD